MMKSLTRFVLWSATLALMSGASAAAQSISTDKSDYVPNSIVTVTGTGFLPGELVTMVFSETPPYNPDVTVTSTADTSGGFTNSDFVVEANADMTSFVVVATSASGLTAQTTFTDALPGKGSLCAAVSGAGDTICPTATGAVGVVGNPSVPTNQRYKQVLGTAATYVIIGAVDAVVDGATGPCPGQVNMHLENPIAGQVNFCSTNFDGSTITFVAPTLGCQITLVDYKVGVSAMGVDQFRTANNDIVADGIDDGTPNGGAGIQYVYATGEVVSCAVTTTQIHDPNHTPIVTAAPGSVVHDAALVTGTPGKGIPAGSVTFTFYTNDPRHMCTGPSVFAGTVTLDATGAADPSMAFGPLGAGDYSFRAKFKPDSGPYNDHGLAYSYGDCEPLAITQVNMTTDIQTTTGVSVRTAHVGDLIQDTATVTLPPPSVIPSGSTVTFNIFNTADCTGPFSAQTVSIASGVSSAVATSPSVSLIATGALSFRAAFNSGNTNEVPNGVAACEPLDILNVPTSLTTQVHNPSHVDITNQTVPLGTVIHDSATVAGQVGAIPITGTITYQFFTNGACSGAPAGSDTESVGTESTTQLLGAGSYSYLTSYSGDSNYAPSRAACEPVAVGAALTSVTTQVHNPSHVDITGQTVPAGTVIHDSATVSGQAGAIPITGTVTYQFFGNGTCTGAPTSSETDAVGSESSTQTLAAGSYSYLASYNGDANYAGSTGVCEPVTIAGSTGGLQGGLTMGFWHNKNGLGIIRGGATTGGVCNVGTWLRQFAPFQDLSATATCNAVASYVSTKIGAATAGGSTMNPMLKAQMLATALSVYFSDPSLGGNQTGAPAPLGGISIDLTTIEGFNVTSVFGGASHLTVLQILTYAAGQSNVGGSVWYGQVKANQEMAKDTFDAINNDSASAF